ncbi:hypothetical protein Sango_3069300 [Sesamum angolense]|uniref:CCHC-type domain-containing protein n=1 Tax=Sesamum angolense TaxID=2727404 RepID=A0AAE1VYY0_9LAMI|nr:hypothetical protein Sango_3069300 [Sesamum angolense]
MDERRRGDLPNCRLEEKNERIQEKTPQTAAVYRPATRPRAPGRGSLEIMRLAFSLSLYSPQLLIETLPEGFLPGERLTFAKFTQWHEDNRKVRSIVLSSMSNEIQKQYERYEDVWSIMHRMKELYAVPDRHIRYAVTKAFFGARMIEGSSVREHGVMMLSLVEKLKILQADLEKEETYVDVILQSLPPTYNQFIINYNMIGHEKSLHELINMLVQYEATIEKSAPSALVGEVSTSKAKAKDAGREKRKKDETFSTTASTVPVTPLGGGKGKRKRVHQSKILNDVCIYCREKGHWKRECPELLSGEGEDEE